MAPVPGSPTPAEAARPRLRYTPARNWMNDPNGLIHLAGVWHLFYQYNPHGTLWGNMSWGHATSTDLLHWTEHPVAITGTPDHAIFSGSIVQDGTGALVAAYTGHNPGPPQQQAQNLAISRDGGMTWTRHPANPVLDLGLAEFRDPKLFWHPPTAHWIMVTVEALERRALFHTSPDLLHWQHAGSFGPAGTPGQVWECPDLIELPHPNGGTAWLFKVDVFEGAATGGSGALAFVGQFDGTRFTPTEPWQWVDHGQDFYAAASWANTPGRAVWIAWMSSHHYAAALPDQGWRGGMTLPRELRLCEDGTGHTILAQSPVAEYDAARTILFDQGPIAAPARLDLPATAAFELELVFVPAPRHALALYRADGTGWHLTWEQGRLAINRLGLHGGPDAPYYAAPATAPVPTLTDARLLFDAGSVEVFANGGRTMLTQLLPGTAPFTTLAVNSGELATVKVRGFAPEPPLGPAAPDPFTK